MRPGLNFSKLLINRHKLWDLSPYNWRSLTAVSASANPHKLNAIEIHLHAKRLANKCMQQVSQLHTIYWQRIFFQFPASSQGIIIVELFPSPISIRKIQIPGSCKSSQVLIVASIWITEKVCSGRAV